MTDQNYIYHETSGCPILTWTKGVPVEDAAMEQLRNVASLPFVHNHVAAMPDVHWGMGATVGSVVPTKGAIIPAAVGVDIGCGMCAARTNLTRPAERVVAFYNQRGTAGTSRSSLPRSRFHGDCSRKFCD